ncbi:MAG: pilus assembly protein TadG-related protein [Actinomycetia bacterium]|nr:pilus assembly protein TadG-related protein [Actinomycetes bacterium]
MTRQRHHDRGQSVTVFIAVAMVALLAVAGLVVDGGRRATTTRDLQLVAQQAARAGADSAAQLQINGDSGSRATAGAQRFLAAAGVSGSARVRGTVIEVETRAQVPTVFLSVIGIRSLSASGWATAQIEQQR